VHVCTMYVYGHVARNKKLIRNFMGREYLLEVEETGRIILKSILNNAASTNLCRLSHK
jgi:hypothetical protein